jgi:arginase
MRSGGTDILRSHGHPVQQQQLEPTSEWRAELRAAFELQRQVAVAASDAHRYREIPMLLSGNCNATIGMLAGLAESHRRVGLLWFDAHGDFNTPETDPFGFLDGQALAMAVNSATLALYDPSCDSDARMNEIALRLLALLADSATPAKGTG